MFVFQFIRRRPAVWCLVALGTFFSPALNAAADTDKPATLRDLQQVQKKVQAVLSMAEKALVAIESGSGAASGVIVHPDGLVLTAAHVTMEVGHKYKVILHDGRTVEGTALGLDNSTDAAMLQLPAPATAWPYVSINRETHQLKPGLWCFALGHPGGYDKDRGRVLRVGRLIKIASNMLQSDCVLMAGDSGGPLFNLNGEVIGIHSQIWQGRDQNLHVGMAPFLRSWDAMKRNEVIHTWAQGSGGWIGLSTAADDNDGLSIRAVAKESPAERAALKAGDRILKVNNVSVSAPVDFSEIIRRRPAGEIVTLEVVPAGAEQSRRLDVKLSPRPAD